MTTPTLRSHFAVKFAAAVLRVAAVLTVLFAIGGAATAARFSQLIPGSDITGSVLLILVAAAIGAIVQWGLADSLILVADADDAHVRLEQQLAGLTKVTAPADHPKRTTPPAPTASFVPPGHARRPASFVTADHAPGFRYYPSRRIARTSRIEGLRAGPALGAEEYGQVNWNEAIALVGETDLYYYVETPHGDGWLPKGAAATEGPFAQGTSGAAPTD